MRDDLATKADLLATKADLLATNADLRAEIAGVSKDLEIGLATVRAEISEFKATVESKFRGQTWTMVMVLIAAVGATRFL